MRFSALIFSILMTFGMVQNPALGQAPAPQRQPTPEEMKKIMDATMGSMVPMMGKMTEAMIEAQLAFAGRAETAEKIAIFKKNLYDALVKKGFTPAQAMQITVATVPPSAAPASK